MKMRSHIVKNLPMRGGGASGGIVPRASFTKVRIVFFDLLGKLWWHDRFWRTWREHWKRQWSCGKLNCWARRPTNLGRRVYTRVKEKVGHVGTELLRSDGEGGAGRYSHQRIIAHTPLTICFPALSCVGVVVAVGRWSTTVHNDSIETIFCSSVFLEAERGFSCSVVFKEASHDQPVLREEKRKRDSQQGWEF